MLLGVCILNSLAFLASIHQWQLCQLHLILLDPFCPRVLAGPKSLHLCLLPYLASLRDVGWLCFGFGVRFAERGLKAMLQEVSALDLARAAAQHLRAAAHEPRDAVTSVLTGRLFDRFQAISGHPRAISGHLGAIRVLSR